jgi:hypothetical protein
MKNFLIGSGFSLFLIVLLFLSILGIWIEEGAPNRPIESYSFLDKDGELTSMTDWERSKPHVMVIAGFNEKNKMLWPPIKTLKSVALPIGMYFQWEEAILTPEEMVNKMKQAEGINQ